MDAEIKTNSLVATIHDVSRPVRDDAVTYQQLIAVARALNVLSLQLQQHLDAYTVEHGWCYQALMARAAIMSLNAHLQPVLALHTGDREVIRQHLEHARFRALDAAVLVSERV